MSWRCVYSKGRRRGTNWSKHMWLTHRPNPIKLSNYILKYLLCMFHRTFSSFLICRLLMQHRLINIREQRENVLVDWQTFSNTPARFFSDFGCLISVQRKSFPTTKCLRFIWKTLRATQLSLILVQISHKRKALPSSIRKISSLFLKISFHLKKDY